MAQSESEQSEPRDAAHPDWGGLSVPGAGLALVAGLLQGWSLSWPTAWLPRGEGDHLAWQSQDATRPLWWLQWLALSLLAGLLQSGRGNTQVAWRSAMLYGALFATAWLGVAFGWLYVAMHTYGGMPAVLAALAVTVLAAALGLYYALACAAFRALALGRSAAAALVFAALWLMAELARGVLLTGFGWGAVAYAHLDSPLAAFAPWLGAYGMSTLAAWLAMLTALMLGQTPGAVRLRSLGLIVALLFMSLLVRNTAALHTQPLGRLEVALLQGNIPQGEKFEESTGVPQALRWYGEQLHRFNGALVVAPETAIPLLPQQLPLGYWPALQQRFASGSQAALIGMPLGDVELGYTNSVVGLRPGDSEPWRYDKHHLVPFGEFIPSGFRWFTELMNIPLGDFARGGLGQPTFDWQGQRLATNVCFEDLFGEELAYQFRDPSRAPTILVNISNLAWFGSTAAMDQHLQIARLRALEFGRPFLLATNTGVTAIVDHRAHVLHVLPRDTRAVLQGAVEGRAGLTPYAWWVSRLGLWPYGLGGAAVLLWALRTLRNRR